MLCTCDWCFFQGECHDFEGIPAIDSFGGSVDSILGIESSNQTCNSSNKVETLMTAILPPTNREKYRCTLDQNHTDGDIYVSPIVVLRATSK